MTRIPVRFRIDGVDLRKIDLDSLRANVSIALQENVLFGMSLRDNIRYVVPDASDEQVMAAAQGRLRRRIHRRSARRPGYGAQ